MCCGRINELRNKDINVRDFFLIFLNACDYVSDYRPYSKSKPELNSKKSKSSDAKIFFSVIIFFFFVLKVRLQVLKFDSSLGVEPRINLQLTSKISLELDSKFSFLVNYSR